MTITPGNIAYFAKRLVREAGEDAVFDMLVLRAARAAGKAAGEALGEKLVAYLREEAP